MNTAVNLARVTAAAAGTFLGLWATYGFAFGSMEEFGLMKPRINESVIARWLQPLLTSRGMCTRHITEKFAKLAVALARSIAGAHPAIAILRAGREALVYENPAAEELARSMGKDLVDAALGRMRVELGAGWTAVEADGVTPLKQLTVARLHRVVAARRGVKRIW